MHKEHIDAVARSIADLAGMDDPYVKSAVVLLNRSLTVQAAERAAAMRQYSDAGEGWFRVINTPAPADLGFGDMVELADGVVYHIATPTSGNADIFDVCSLDGDRRLVERIEIVAFKRGGK